MRQELIKKKKNEKFTKLTTCLFLSFTASVTGWSRPPKETLLGPTRVPIYLKIFRSNRVIKATAIKTGSTNMTKLTTINSSRLAPYKDSKSLA